MSTINDSDLLLVERNGNLHQITYDQMSTLNDDDILLVERGGVQYKVEAQYVSTGPNGVILPSVEVLTPLNGAGLNDGQSYTPMSSAYVSTDTSDVYFRHSYLVETISGGTWDDLNLAFNGNYGSDAVLSGVVGEVSQATIYMDSAIITEGNGFVYGWATNGGTAEVLDENEAVLRTYALPTATSTFVELGIIRPEYKIRLTTAQQNEELKLSAVLVDSYIEDYVIPGRVAFEFTDDTDLDKMVAPIIQTDANGDVKVPTTSTVDSTTSIPGEEKAWNYTFVGNGAEKTISMYSDGIAPTGDRMMWAKVNASYSGVITDSVGQNSGYSGGSAFMQTATNGATISGGPVLNENDTTLPVANSWNRHGSSNYIAEIGVAPKVLDIVTWTGDGTIIQEIPHNLGCKPGMIIVKRAEANGNWAVWHKDLSYEKSLVLNTSQGETSLGHFPSEPTKDSFYVTGDSYDTGINGGEYVAYVFAAETPGKVKCGTYTGTGGSQLVELGFRPGFVLVKDRYNSNSWAAANQQSSDNGVFWEPNNDSSMQGESQNFINMNHTANYMRLQGNDARLNTNSGKYIYLAVAFDLTGPNSTQLNLLSGQDLEYFTTGTQITSNAAASGSNISFSSNTYSGNGQYYLRQPYLENNNSWYDIRYNSGNKWLTWIKKTNQSKSHYFFDSERSLNTPIYSDYSQAEAYTSQNYIVPYDEGAGYRTGPGDGVNQSGHNYIHWHFLAAPQFFDVQKYIGVNGSNTIQHNLGVEPGCIIIKNTDTSNSWWVWHSELSEGYYMYLNSQNAQQPQSANWCAPTDTDFTLNVVGGGLNQTGNSFISYIFAKDTPYVKCGQYIGAGAGGTTVSVGFKPRWVLIKCKTGNSTGWIILDKNLQGNNEYLSANSSSGVGYNTYTFTADGFTVASEEVSSSVTNGGDTYIYIAIADESEGHPPNPPSTSTVTETPDPNTAQMVVNAESFDVGATASAPALEASITSVGGSEGNKLFVDASTGTWVPGLYAKGSETTIDAPGPDEITFTSQNQGTPEFSGVDATLASRTWTLESGTTATGPWTLVDTYVDYDVLNSQTGATPWTSNKPNLTPNTFYRVKVQYNSTNAESVESVYNTFKTGDA